MARGKSGRAHMQSPPIAFIAQNGAHFQFDSRTSDLTRLHKLFKSDSGAE